MPSRIILAVLLLGPPLAAQDVTVFQLDDLPSGANKNATVKALSGDGQFIYGDQSAKLVRWSADGSAEDLGPAPARLDDASYDGSVIVGNMAPPPGCGNVGQAYRWTESEGYVMLDCDTGPYQTYARGVSSDGTTVVVHRAISGADDYVWELGIGQKLFFEEPGGGGLGHETRAVTGDGLIAVGAGSVPEGNHATRWSTVSGFHISSEIIGGYTNSKYTNVSADGTAYVGEYKPAVATPFHAFALIDDVFIALDTPDGHSDVYVHDVSNGGTVIVGRAFSTETFKYEAVIWLDGEPEAHMLDDWLVAQGVSLAGFGEFTEALAVSDDGLTILAHSGISPQKGVLIRRSCGEVTHYGAGLAGSGGFVPLLDATDPCLGQDFTLDIDESLGGATAHLVYGFVQLSAPFKGGTLHVDPTYQLLLPLSGPLGTPGAGAVSLNSVLPPLPGLDGLDLHFQAIVPDAGAVAGFALSDGMTLTFALP